MTSGRHWGGFGHEFFREIWLFGWNLLLHSPAGRRDRLLHAPPCRLIDTRANDGPALQPFSERAFALAGICGIPSTARALAVNLTVFEPAAQGYVQVYPGDTAPPPTSAVNVAAGQVRSNNAIVALASDGTTTLNARAGSPGALHLIIDVLGYFQ